MPSARVRQKSAVHDPHRCRPLLFVLFDVQPEGNSNESGCRQESKAQSLRQTRLRRRGRVVRHGDRPRACGWTETHTKGFLPLVQQSEAGTAGAPAASTAAAAAAAVEMAPGESVDIVLGLNLRNEAQLDQYLHDLHTPGSPHYRQFLTPAQFASQYAPTDQQVASVVAHLRKAGFVNIVVAPNRLLVSASGTAATIKSAFRTTLKRFTRNGRSVYANTDAAQVPNAIGGVVGSVLGLQNVELMHKGAGSQPQRQHQQPDDSGRRIGGAAQPDRILVDLRRRRHADRLADHRRHHLRRRPVADGKRPQYVRRKQQPRHDQQQHREDPVRQLVHRHRRHRRMEPRQPVDRRRGRRQREAGRVLRRAVDDAHGDHRRVQQGRDRQRRKGDQRIARRMRIVREQHRLAGHRRHHLQAGSRAGANLLGIRRRPWRVRMRERHAVALDLYGERAGNVAVRDRRGRHDAVHQYVDQRVQQRDRLERSELAAGHRVVDGRRVQQVRSRAVVAIVEPHGIDQAHCPTSASTRTCAPARFSSSTARRPTRCAGYLNNEGGTSLAAPIFTGIWARLQSANNNALGFPASSFYKYFPSNAALLHDVTSGNNGSGTLRLQGEGRLGRDDGLRQREHFEAEHVHSEHVGFRTLMDR